MDYYTCGNCGVVDYIYDTVMSLCSDTPDYQIVIDKLEAKSRGSTFSSYYRTLLARLYEKVGDETAQLKTLEQGLEYGMDYWRLAQYWFKKGDKARALEIVQQGIRKGTGRKDELYDYLQQVYEKRGEFDQLLELLRTKIETGSYQGFKTDPAYRSLKRRYESEKDYAGQVELLELHFTSRRVELDFYKEAEQMLNKTDWPGFEKKLLAHLTKESKKKQSSWGWYGGSQERKSLAQIYKYKKDLANLFETVKGTHDLLDEYAKELIPLHPEYYLKVYRSRIRRLIENRGRGNYQTAAAYAATVKKIYQKHLKQPEAWVRYIANLRAENKKLRALQEELRRL